MLTDTDNRKRDLKRDSISYGQNVPEMHRRAAMYVNRILKGARPTDFPLEQPTRFEMVVNLKTAKMLGLSIPQSVLLPDTSSSQFNTANHASAY